jgi:hypothetical protein
VGRLSAAGLGSVWLEGVWGCCLGLGGGGGVGEEAVADVEGQGHRHEEEHGAGEDEAVGGPFWVEEAGVLHAEGSEEAGEASGGDGVLVDDAGVAGAPGEVAEEEGGGDGDPGPESCGDEVEAALLLLLEGARHRATEALEGDEPGDEAGGGEDGQEVAEGEGEAVEGGPVEAGGDAPDGEGEDPGKPDREDGHDQVKKEALSAPVECFEHDFRCSTSERVSESAIQQVSELTSRLVSGVLTD